MRPPSLEAEEDQSGEVGGVGRACDLPATRLSWLPVGARGKEKPPFERQEALSAAFWVLEAFGSLTFLLLLCWVSMASAPLLPAASLLGTLAILSQGPAFLFTRTFNANLQVLLCQPADEDAENLEHLHFMAGMQNGIGTKENSKVLKKLRLELPYDPAILLLSIYLKVLKSRS